MSIIIDNETNYNYVPMLIRCTCIFIDCFIENLDINYF